MKKPLTYTLALLASAVVACAPDPTGPPPVLTALPRALTAAETQISTRSNAFAFELFRRASAATDSNTFVSPLSVSMALGMTMNGAANTTLDSMRATLGFESMPLADINAGYRGLIDLLGLTAPPRCVSPTPSGIARASPPTPTSETRSSRASTRVCRRSTSGCRRRPTR
jgi:serine protease inhibitor